MRCNGGSRRTVALSTSVSKQYTAQPRSGPGTVRRNRSSRGDVAQDLVEIGKVSERTRERGEPDGRGTRARGGSSCGGTSTTAGRPRRSTTIRSPSATRSRSSEKRRFASATPILSSLREYTGCHRTLGWTITGLPRRRLRSRRARVHPRSRSAAREPYSRPFAELIASDDRVRRNPRSAGLSRQADDGGRTRDLRLGKPTLCQLSYVRAPPILGASRGRRANDRSPARCAGLPWTTRCGCGYGRWPISLTAVTSKSLLTRTSTSVPSDLRTWAS